MFVDFLMWRLVFATVWALVIILGGATPIPSLPIAEFRSAEGGTWGTQLQS